MLFSNKYIIKLIYKSDVEGKNKKKVLFYPKYGSYSSKLQHYRYEDKSLVYLILIRLYLIKRLNLLLTKSRLLRLNPKE